MFDDPRHLLLVTIAIIVTAGWLINNWIRAKHGYPLESDLGNLIEADGEGTKVKRLKAENRELNDKLDAMQDRMVVLERIVTDRGYSLSEEIEALRDTPVASSATGVPLNLKNKEKQQ